MILKPIQLVLDSSGNQIDLNYRPIRSHTSYRHIVQIVAPNLATEACDVTVSTYGKEIVSETTRTRLAVDANGTYLKGSAVVDEDEAYYSSVTEYNVWEVELVGPVASILQKVNSSKVSIVVSFSMPVVDANALVNVGSFGSSGDLPVISTETVGDYRVCDSLAYTSTRISTEFKYNDIAYYDGSTWIKGKVFRMIQTCPMIQLSVDPSLALMYDEPTDELAEVLIDDVARVDGIVSDVQTKVNTLLADNLNLNNDITNLEDKDLLHEGRLDVAEAELIRLESDKADITYVDSQDAIIGSRLDTVETRIDDNDTELLRLEADKADITYVDTKDGIISGRLNTLETFKDTTVPATYETKTSATSKLVEAKTYTDDQIGLNVTDKLGVANGIATIGADGYIPSSQVANSFDDVLEFATYAALIAYSTPTTGKLYVVVADENSNDNHSTYRYTGTIYIRVSDEMSASEIKALYESNANTNVVTDILKSNYDTSYSHSQVTDGTNPHGTTFANVEEKPTTILGFGITDAYTKTEIDANHYTDAEVDIILSELQPSLGLQSTILTPTDLLNTDSILTSAFNNKAFIVLVATNLDTHEVDTDTITVASIVVGKKFYFFDDQNINFEIGTTSSVFSSTSNVSLKINAFSSTDAVNASQVSYVNTASELTATQAQAAIDELKELVDGKADLDIEDAINSAARLWGGLITPNGDGTVAIGAGAGLSKVDEAGPEDVPTSMNQGQASTPSIVSWSAVASLSLTDNTYNYIYFDRTDGQIKATTNFYSISFTQDFTIGRAYRSGTNVVVRMCGTNAWNFDRRVQLFGEEVFPVVRASGMSLSTSGLNLLVSGGVLWAELVNRFTTASFDSAGTDRFTYWYRSATPGLFTSVANQSTLNNTNYDDGDGTLGTVTLNPLKYGVHWVYQVHDGSVHVVYGRGDYTLAEAQASNPPTDIPGLLSSYAVLVGRVIIARNATSAVQVESAFTEIFGTSNVTDHADLTGIQGGSAGDYQHITTAEKSSYDTAVGWGDHSTEGYLTSETNTSLTLVANTLTYTDETGTPNTIDLSLYLDDTNLARIISGTYNSELQTLVFTRDDASTFSIDASMFLDDTNLVTSVNGSTGTVVLDSDDIAEGSVNLYADANATNQGNTFNGNSQLVQTTADGKLPVIDGSNLTGLPSGVDTHNDLLGIQGGATGDYQHLTTAEVTKLSGIEAGAEVNDAATTLQGNTFNGNSQLVQTTADGKLPVIDGSNLTGIATGATSLDGLSDVVITTPSDNQFIRHNGTNFVNESVTILALANYTTNLPTTG